MLCKLKAIVLLSGGQNSTTCLGWAVREYGKENVHAITFNYGQRNQRKVELARNNFFDIIGSVHNHKVMMLPMFDFLTVDLANASDEKFKHPLTMPGRNLIMLSVASSYAYSIGIRNVIIGISQEDYPNFPDHSEDMLKHANQAVSSAMKEPFNLLAPLIRTKRCDTFKLAKELNILDKILFSTITCCRGITTMWEWGAGCGNCEPCKIRIEGYNKFRKENK